MLGLSNIKKIDFKTSITSETDQHFITIKRSLYLGDITLRNVWQNPLQYCKVLSLHLIKINEKKRDVYS